MKVGVSTKKKNYGERRKKDERVASTIGNDRSTGIASQCTHFMLSRCTFWVNFQQQFTYVHVVHGRSFMNRKVAILIKETERERERGERERYRERESKRGGRERGG